MAPRLEQGTCWAIEDPAEKDGWDLWDSWDLCVLSVIRRRHTERLLRRFAFVLSPTRPLAGSQKKRPPGLQPNGRSCYHATLLCLTVSFLYRHVVTAGLTIPYLDQRLAGAAFAFG
jgi:hypothetical protein